MTGKERLPERACSTTVQNANILTKCCGGALHDTYTVCTAYVWAPFEDEVRIPSGDVTFAEEQAELQGTVLAARLKV